MNVSAQRRLSPALAGKLYGKLMFLSSQYFGRLGRALLRACPRRQHELNRSGLNPQLVAAIRFWTLNMRDFRPGEVPFSFNVAPMFVSYSDGEGEGAGDAALASLCGSRMDHQSPAN